MVYLNSTPHTKPTVFEGLKQREEILYTMVMENLIK